ncbi:MAG: hypothetical protein AAFP19_06565 [Bacteroidota bacterium]
MPYQKALEKTELILQKIKQAIGPNRQLVLFNADAYEPQQGDIASICAQNDIDFIAFPKMAMDTAGREVYTIDGFHWNEQGHQIIAGVLAEQLLLD